jgi:S1-C subfamily serine protease
VPILEKADLVRLLEPHEAKVVVASAVAPRRRTGAAAPAQEAPAEGEKSIEFTLGGGAKSASAGSDSSTPVEPATPTRSGRRSFARGAVGFAVGPELLLTAASAVKDASRVVVEFPNGQPMEATVERTGTEGLALLRIRGQKMAYVNLAQQFAGGAVQCPAYPEVSVFGVSVEVLKGKTLGTSDEGWKVSLGKHPRLAGAPLLDSNGDLVGVEMADREDLSTQLPALSLKAVRAFLGSDLPGQPCGNPRAAAVVQVTGSFER